MKASPFLLFDGNCADAMTFYHSCMGGELTLTKLGDTPMKSSFPPDKHDRIINARLSAGSVDISATDWMASPDLEPKLGNMSAVFLTADRHDELKPVFDKLAQGASKDWFQDLHQMPFGWYGQFFDRFGVQWIFRAAQE